MEQLNQKISPRAEKMISAMDKGIEAAKISQPPKGSYAGYDLTTLPKYVCFRAALLQQKATWRFIALGVVAISFIYIVASQRHIIALSEKYRMKEYILAPGVHDFTPALPQSVSDEYIKNAFLSFLSRLGNINPINIDEQYRELSKQMSPELSVRFQAEVSDWIQIVNRENISEIVKSRPQDREIISDGEGNYKATAIVKRDRYINSEFSGSTEEVIEMSLRLVPPEQGRQWYLQIEELSRTSTKDFRN